MEVRFVSVDGEVETHGPDDVMELLARGDGIVWVDIPACDERASQVLLEVFGFHPLAVADCQKRNHVPKVHAYHDHVFLVLHAPERGDGGHVHYLELDQFIGPGFLVTVHGPTTPDIGLEATLRETQGTLARIESGRLRPTSSFELSYAIVSALTRHEATFMGTLASEVALLEQQVMADNISSPEDFLEELFRARHELLAVRTTAAQSREIFRRMQTLARFVPGESQVLVADLLDQYERVRSLADGQKEFLQSVIEFYRARTDTKLTIAAERLAVIAAVTLPITALSSIYGMNVIVNESTHVRQLVVVLIVMAIMSATLLRWAKRQGWW
jgi:Mg2+ and Co2+ transporter CorA